MPNLESSHTALKTANFVPVKKTVKWGNYILFLFASWLKCLSNTLPSSWVNFNKEKQVGRGGGGGGGGGGGIGG